MSATDSQNHEPAMHLEPKAAQAAHANGAYSQGIPESEIGQQNTRGSDLQLLGGGGQPVGRQISVTLTPEQFEQLYLQPGGVGGKGDLSKRLGNPTPLGLGGFLLCLTPLSIYFMQFGKTTSASATTLVGAYYALGGVCMILSGIFEFIIGNTFPFIVFVLFGGFWIAFAILNDPSIGIALAYSATGVAAEGTANPLFAEAVAIYLICWGVLVFVLLIGSLRTNVAFVCVFTMLDITFFILAAAYFRIGEARDPTTLIKAAGAFAFIVSICGWWIMLALVLGSTGIPIPVPLGDLSGFLARK